MPDYSPQIDALRARWQAEPQSRVFAQLAEALRKEGHFDEAVKICQQGLERHPDYAAALVTMGRAHHEAGRVSEAEIALEKAITLSPANLVANRLLGDIAMQNGDHGKALERYTMLQQLNPGDPEIELLIARCEAALPEIQEALVKGEPTVKVTHAEARAAAQAPAAAAESAPTPALEETAPVSAPEPQAGREPAETQEAAAPEIGISPEAPGLTSETLAELYVEQGHAGHAVRAYERLLAREPGNERWNARLAQLRQMAPETPPEASPAAASLPATGAEGGVLRRQLMSDIASLRDDARAAKVRALRGWLTALDRGKEQHA
jgi:tetratricopeptide (TPR) repeat protein